MAADRMILGKNVVVSTDCNETNLNNNKVVCGTSGCGKTMSVLEPQLLETNNDSLIIPISKRILFKKYRPLFIARGYDVEETNFVTPMESTTSYDPLKYVHNYSDITYLARSIVMADSRKEKSSSDPFWDQAAVSLLSGMIAFAIMMKENASFSDVLELLDKINITQDENDNLIHTNFDSYFNQLAEKDPSCFAVSCWRSFHELPIKTASCVFSTLNTTIDTIFNPDIRKMMSLKTKIDFKKIASKRTVLFITTSAVNPSFNFLINMFYSQAFKELFEFAEGLPSGKLPIPVNILCDDFAVSGGKIQNFPEYISIIREKQIAVTILIQSESQLESIYGADDATTIINNCDTYIYMGGMDLNTGKAISQRINKPLEDVLYMPIGQVFIFRRGQKPIITTRYDIKDDKRYQNITEEYEKQITDQERESDCPNSR